MRSSGKWLTETFTNRALLLLALMTSVSTTAFADAALKIHAGDSPFGTAILTVEGSRVRLGNPFALVPRQFDDGVFPAL